MSLSVIPDQDGNDDTVDTNEIEITTSNEMTITIKSEMTAIESTHYDSDNDSSVRDIYTKVYI